MGVFEILVAVQSKFAPMPRHAVYGAKERVVCRRIPAFTHFDGDIPPRLELEHAVLCTEETRIAPLFENLAKRSEERGRRRLNAHHVWSWEADAPLVTRVESIDWLQVDADHILVGHVVPRAPLGGLRTIRPTKRRPCHHLQVLIEEVDVLLRSSLRLRIRHCT